MGISFRALTMVAVGNVSNTQQGIAAAFQTTAIHVGGGFGLAIAAVSTGTSARH
jgi:hypothetical protein